MQVDIASRARRCRIERAGFARGKSLASWAGYSLFFILALFFGDGAKIAHAQVGSAEVLGAITDSTGAVIPKASVTITNLGTSISRSTVSKADGAYLISTLPKGDYRLTVEADGFKKYEISSFSLTSDQHARLDAKLEPGVVTEKIEVTDAAANLQTDTTSINSTVDTLAVQDLPMANRNFYGVVQTLPGVSMGSQGGSTSTGSKTSGTTANDRRPNSTVVANGQSDSSNNQMVNGFDNNEVIYGSIGVRPTVDGIAEMAVSSGNSAAETGRAAGAVVNVVTKSGTNHWHGSLFEYFRNEATDARNYFNHVLKNGVYVPDTKASMHQNNFGGSIGGPIKKDKSFFFFAYEKDMINKGYTFTEYVPTKYEHDNIGDFSDYAVVSGQTEGPVMDSSAIVPYMKTFWGLYPAPNAGESNGLGTYTSSPNWVQRIYDWELRVDHQFSARDRFYARYADNPAHTVFPSAFPTVNGISGVGGSQQQSAGPSNTNTKNVQLDYVHDINSNLLFDLKAGYSRYDSKATGPNTSKGIAAKMDIPNAAATGALGDDTPELDGPMTYSTLGGPINVPLTMAENSYQYAGSVIYTHGPHSIKAGGGFIRRQVNYQSASSAAGIVVYGVAGPGAPYDDWREDMLAGFAIMISRSTAVGEIQGRASEWSAYVSDDWRATPKLTLNLGLRYDVYQPYKAANGNISNFDLDTLNDGLTRDTHNFILGGTGGIGTDFGNVAPRVGAAYSLNAKTVLRGGFGLAYSPSTQKFITSNNAPYEFAYTYHWVDTSDASNWVNPTTMTLSDWNSTSYLTTVTGFPKTALSQRNYQVNLSFQRELDSNSSVTASYVGVYNRRMSASIDRNVPDMPGAGNATPAYKYTINSGTTSWNNPNGTMEYVTSIGDTIYNGLANYNAMQLVYNRRLSKGLLLDANWTWSHILGTTVGANQMEQDYGNGSNDIRHRITARFNYALPFGNSLHGVAGALLHGWQSNGVFQWQTGQPWMVQSGVTCSTSLDSRCVNASDESYLNQPGTPNYRPDIVGKVMVHGKINREAFAPPTPGTQGNEAVNQFTGPHFRSMDVSMMKDFKLKDNLKLQFRAECFNISNTPNFVLIQSNIKVNAWEQGTVTSTNSTGLIASTSGNFGQSTDTAGGGVPREFQFALKVLF